MLYLLKPKDIILARQKLSEWTLAKKARAGSCGRMVYLWQWSVLRRGLSIRIGIRPRSVLNHKIHKIVKHGSRTYSYNLKQLGRTNFRSPPYTLIHNMWTETSFPRINDRIISSLASAAQDYGLESTETKYEKNTMYTRYYCRECIGESPKEVTSPSIMNWKTRTPVLLYRITFFLDSQWLRYRWPW
jgi:hypothetical protein